MNKKEFIEYLLSLDCPDDTPVVLTNGVGRGSSLKRENVPCGNILLDGKDSYWLPNSTDIMLGFVSEEEQKRIKTLPVVKVIDIIADW